MDVNSNKLEVLAQPIKVAIIYTNTAKANSFKVVDFLTTNPLPTN